MLHTNDDSKQMRRDDQPQIALQLTIVFDHIVDTKLISVKTKQNAHSFRKAMKKHAVQIVVTQNIYDFALQFILRHSYHLTIFYSHYNSK